MVTQRIIFTVALLCSLMLSAIVTQQRASAQYQQAQRQQFNFKVDKLVTGLELTEKTSRKLTFDYQVPEIVIGNQEVLSATPISPNEILIRGLKPGVTTLTIFNEHKKSQSIDIHVLGDVRKLEAVLHGLFPDSHIKVSAMNTGVFLSGTVARADAVNKIVNVSKRYFPEVENNLRVGGSQLVAIEIQVYEVSRTKLRQMGFDWSVVSGGTTIVQSVADLITSSSVAAGTTAIGAGQTLQFGVINDGTTFSGFLQALEKKNLAKLMDKPTLVAVNGRPAEFLSGGEVPILVNGGLGVASVEFRPFGTKLDIVPIILGNGRVRLEVRAEVSEVANDLSGNTGTPGFRVRRVNTGVEMRAGHTLAMAGDFREEVETEVKGLPYLVNTPYLGTLFRRVEEQKNEVELVFLVTPRFVGDVETHQLPAYGPGQSTVSPSDQELYFNGHLEVPRCDDSCEVNIHRPFASQVNPNPGRVDVNGLQHQAVGLNGPGQTGQSGNVYQNVTGSPDAAQQKAFPRFQLPSQPASNKSSGFGYPNSKPNTQPNKQREGVYTSNRWPSTSTANGHR